MATLALVPAYRIKITLTGVKPPVWRRVVLPGAWHLGRVHEAVQTAMGWTNTHLHEFEREGLRWGQPDPDWGSADVRREATARLHELLPAVGERITYTYDFGDDWRHVLLVEELLPPVRTATCLAGSGACPPEDSGGPWGYAARSHLIRPAIDLTNASDIGSGQLGPGTTQTAAAPGEEEPG